MSKLSEHDEKLAKLDSMDKTLTDIKNLLEDAKRTGWDRWPERGNMSPHQDGALPRSNASTLGGTTDVKKTPV